MGYDGLARLADPAARQYLQQLERRVATAEGAVSALQATVTAQAETITSLRSRITDLSSRLLAGAANVPDN